MLEKKWETEQERKNQSSIQVILVHSLSVLIAENFVNGGSMTKIKNCISAISLAASSG